MTLRWIDYLIIALYSAFVLGVGVALKRYMRTSTDFFLSGRRIAAWITGLAFVSANLGALEVIPKPFDPMELSAQIQRIWAEK